MVSTEPSFSLDWAPDAIIVTGLDGSILGINPRAEDLFGYREDELIDKPLELVIPEGMSGTALESSPLQHASRAVTCAHRDGTRFPCTARWRPAPAGQGDFVVFSIRDHEPEERPAEGAEPSQPGAHPRPDATGPHARRETPDASITGNGPRVELLSLFAHDVRESLQAIQYLCDAVRARAPAEAATIGEIVGSICKLLERLLRFSRSNAIEPLIEPCALTDVLGTLERELMPLAQRKGLGLSIAPVDDTIRTDPVLFRELLHNLIANAIRYTEAGRVDVRCRRGSANVRVEIADTGPGIARERVLAAASPTPPSGAGLGLTIVHRLAEHLACTIDVDSAPGRGTRFVVVAPFDIEERRRRADRPPA